MAVADRRPKDMSNAELEALPTRGVGGVECELVDPTPEMLEAKPWLLGKKLKRPIMRRKRAITVQPDDLLIWRDREGRDWQFALGDDGWFKYPWIGL